MTEGQSDMGGPEDDGGFSGGASIDLGTFDGAGLDEHQRWLIY